MKDLLKSLKEKHLIAVEQHDLLKHNFNNVSKHLFADQMKNSKGDSRLSNRYSPEMKQFAMTLHYYSPKAYEFARNVLSLLHASTIRAWASSVDCQPGFLDNVIKSIGECVQMKGWMSNVVLIVDTMALYKGTIWDPKSKSYVGLVDYGTAKPEPEENMASEALVFMISGITGHWKHPVAYFLQDKCSAVVQAQLITDCIGLLSAEGLNAVALVFDGTYTNQSTAKLLGCKMKVSERKTWFPHPQHASEKVYVIFDVCHMIKLMRNLLGDYKTISHDAKGILHRIDWRYIDSLNNIQEDLGFTLANKLKKKYIEWTKHKMNISIATQTLSSSVANAIDFLHDEMNHPAFEGSEATTDFIEKVDTAFDLMNSKNPFAKGNKAPVSLENLAAWIDKCQKLADYLFALKDEKGNYLRCGHRKTVIWGFVFSIESIASIVKHLLTCKTFPYKYVLTYKFSQDHLELLFNKIR